MKIVQKLYVTIHVICLLIWSVPVSAEITVSSGAQLNRSQKEEDDSHVEEEGARTTLLVPFGVRYKYGKRLTLSAESAYSRITDDEATVYSLADTAVSISYIIPKLPLPVMCGLMLNLPTGREDLGNEHDDTGEDVSGQGLNLGLNLSISKKYLENFTFGVNTQYAYQGAYDSTDDVPDDTTDPGDHLMGNIKVQWKYSPALKLGAMVSYLYLWPEKVGGQKMSQEGGMLTINGNTEITRQPFVFGLNAQYKVPGSSKTRVDGKLVTEDENGRGQTLGTSVNMTYIRSQTLVFQGSGSLQYTRESEYRESGLPYAGTTMQIRVGPGVTYHITPALQCNLSARYTQATGKASLQAEYDTTSRGFNLMLGVAYTLK